MGGDLCVCITANMSCFNVNYVIEGKYYKTQTEAIKIALDRWLIMKDKAVYSKYIEIMEIKIFTLNLWTE